MTIVVALVALVALLVLATRVRAHRLTSPDDHRAEELSPLFAAGIALSGAGVALAVTIGPIMYLMVAIGLVVMIAGIQQTRQGR